MQSWLISEDACLALSTFMLPLPESSTRDSQVLASHAGNFNPLLLCHNAICFAAVSRQNLFNAEQVVEEALLQVVLLRLLMS